MKKKPVKSIFFISLITLIGIVIFSNLKYSFYPENLIRRQLLMGIPIKANRSDVETYLNKKHFKKIYKADTGYYEQLAGKEPTIVGSSYIEYENANYNFILFSITIWTVCIFNEDQNLIKIKVQREYDSI